MRHSQWHDYSTFSFVKLSCCASLQQLKANLAVTMTEGMMTMIALMYIEKWAKRRVQFPF